MATVPPQSLALAHTAVELMHHDTVHGDVVSAAACDELIDANEPALCAAIEHLMSRSARRRGAAGHGVFPPSSRGTRLVAHAVSLYVQRRHLRFAPDLVVHAAEVRGGLEQMLGNMLHDPATAAIAESARAVLAAAAVAPGPPAADAVRELVRLLGAGVRAFFLLARAEDPAFFSANFGPAPIDALVPTPRQRTPAHAAAVPSTPPGPVVTTPRAALTPRSPDVTAPDATAPAVTADPDAVPGPVVDTQEPMADGDVGDEDAFAPAAPGSVSPPGCAATQVPAGLHARGTPPPPRAVLPTKLGSASPQVAPPGKRPRDGVAMAAPTPAPPAAPALAVEVDRPGLLAAPAPVAPAAPTVEMYLCHECGGWHRRDGRGWGCTRHRTPFTLPAL